MVKVFRCKSQWVMLCWVLGAALSLQNVHGGQAGGSDDCPAVSGKIIGRVLSCRDSCWGG